MNTHYKTLRALLAIITQHGALDDLIAEAMERNGTPVSKSRLQGWRVSEDRRNYRHMSKDEFLDVLNALIAYYSR
jgi:hypothetical protein